MRLKLTQRDIQAQETRRRLMEAARNLLTTTEYMKLRVSDIAKAAGVSVGTFYIYFPRKQDVVISQLREINDSLSTMQPINPQESIEKQYCDYVDYYHQSMLRNGYMLSKALHTAIMLEGIDPADAGVYMQSDYLSRLIETGMKTGELRAGVQEVGGFLSLFFSSIDGVLFVWIASGGDMRVLADGMEKLKLLIRIMK